MRKQLIIIGVILLLLIVGFTGCNQQNSSSNNSSTNQSKNQTNPPPSTETIQTILAKAETITSMYYEIASTTSMSGAGMQNTTIKIWQKTPYLKEEMTSTTAGFTTTLSIIQRPEGIYQFDTTQNKYVLTTSVTIPQKSSSETVKNLLNNYTITNLGTEIIDGKTATVIQYTMNPSEGSMTVKMWIWNERGLPLKAQYTGTIGETIVTMDYVFSHYSFADIPDITFNVS